LKEGCGDSKKDGILNFANDVCNMVRGVSSNSNTRSSGKRKERKHFVVQTSKRRNSGIGLQLLSCWDQLVDNMSNNSDSTSISKDRKMCIIPEVISKLHSIERVNIGDDFHGFATECLGLRRNKEMWSTMENLKNKMKWLRRIYTRSKTP
jgi:hypothetical protein